MTSPSDDGARGSDAPDAFSLDLQPLPHVPEKVTIRKDRAKYSQEEEYIVEGESRLRQANPAPAAKKTSARGIVTVVAVTRTASVTAARTVTSRIATAMIVAVATTIASFVTAKTVASNAIWTTPTG